MIYFSFKEWFIFTEAKKPYDIALEIVKKNGGDEETLKKFSNLLPVDLKDRNKILALTVFYGLHREVNPNGDVSKADDQNFMNQLKTDITDYLNLLSQNQMPVLSVDDNHNIQVQGAAPNTTTNYNSYVTWTEIIHGKIAERDRKERLSNIKLDLSQMKIVARNPERTIVAYDAHGVEKCIALGLGQKFCISQPANTMWQSYRDTKTSTFYFVYDATRDDRLKIVVVDATDRFGTEYIELTDIVNNTLTIGDPNNPERTLSGEEAVKAYFKYLRRQGLVGIDGEKNIEKIFTNIPKSEQEIEERRLLGDSISDLNKFRNLGYDYMSKYIGRGHLLTNEQFDYIYENYPTLFKQAVTVGIKLPDYQLDKLASAKGKYKDLIANYLHNRLIADEHRNDFSEKEYELLKSKNLLIKEKEILDQKGMKFWINCDIEKLENSLESDNKTYEIYGFFDNQDTFSTFLAIAPINLIEKYNDKFCYRDLTTRNFSCGINFLRKIVTSGASKVTRQNLYSAENRVAYDTNRIMSNALLKIFQNSKIENFEFLMNIFRGITIEENCLTASYIDDRNIVGMAPKISFDSLKTYLLIKKEVDTYDLIATLCKNDDDFTNWAVNKFFTRRTEEYENGLWYLETMLYQSSRLRKFLINALKNAKSKVENYHEENYLKILYYALTLRNNLSIYEKMLNEFKNLPDEENIENWVNQKILSSIIPYKEDGVSSREKNISHKFIREKIDNDLLFNSAKEYVYNYQNIQGHYGYYFGDKFCRLTGSKTEFIDNLISLKNDEITYSRIVEILRETAVIYIKNALSGKKGIQADTPEETKKVLEKFKSIKIQKDSYDNVLEYAVNTLFVGHVSIINTDNMNVILNLLKDDLNKYNQLFEEIFKTMLVNRSETEIKIFESIFSPANLKTFYSKVFSSFSNRFYELKNYPIACDKTIYGLNSPITSIFIDNLTKHFSEYVTPEFFMRLMNEFFTTLKTLKVQSPYDRSIGVTPYDSENKAHESMKIKYFDDWRRFKNFFISKNSKFKEEYESVIDRFKGKITMHGGEILDITKLL
jgi:hypothetical protein